jgi:hypothetical protein
MNALSPEMSLRVLTANGSTAMNSRTVGNQRKTSWLGCEVAVREGFELVEACFSKPLMTLSFGA